MLNKVANSWLIQGFEEAQRLTIEMEDCASKEDRKRSMGQREVSNVEIGNRDLKIENQNMWYMLQVDLEIAKSILDI